MREIYHNPNNDSFETRMGHYCAQVSGADASVCRCRLEKLLDLQVKTCVRRFFKSQKVQESLLHGGRRGSATVDGTSVSDLFTYVVFKHTWLTYAQPAAKTQLES